MLPAGVARAPQLNGGNPNITLPTLYVSGQGSVYAYDLGASGNAPPLSGGTSSGFYYSAGGAGGYNFSIAGIATNTEGDLIVVQNLHAPQSGYSCELAYIPARTGTNAANATFSPCATAGSAVAVTFTGSATGNASSGSAFADDVDVLMHYIPNGNPALTSCAGPTTSQYEVDRYAATSGGITAQGCLVLDQGTAATYAGIAGSTNGTVFADYNSGMSGTVERFDGTSSSTAPTARGTTPGVAGPMAASVNYATGAGYRVVSSVVGGSTTIYSFKVNGNSLTFTHALGAFSNQVAALAVDQNGSIYVGVNQPGGVTKVKVYGPTNTQATSPDYMLNNPVRRPNPSASPQAAITGMAITERAAGSPSPAPVTHALYVADLIANRVDVFSALSSGNVTSAPTGTIGGGSSGINGPAAVALDANGKVYVANSGSSTLTVYAANPSGSVSSAPLATATDGIDSPQGVVLDGTGRVYVSNGGTPSVTVYSPYPALTKIATISGNTAGLCSPGELTLDSGGRIYVADQCNNAVYVFAANPVGSVNAAPVATIQGPNTGLNTSYGITLDATGRILVTNTGNNTVTVYPANPSGTLNEAPVATIGGPNAALANPVGVGVDAAGLIYVSNLGAQNITVYSAHPVGPANSAPLGIIGGGNTGLVGPYGIAVR